MDSLDAVVVAKDLSKSVVTADGPLHILSQISFRINHSESLAITGASGSGKSTLLGLLAGLDSPSAGEIYLCGKALSELDEDGRARIRANNVGFVFQSFQLLPKLTALENVMLPLEVTTAADPEKRARQLLERVGLADRLKHYPQHLSGGEQQRVALARAFVSEPRVLFADEPTGNLDTRTGAKIIELLFELNRENGTTLILVTHDSQLAARCQRQLKLEAGQILT